MINLPDKIDMTLTWDNLEVSMMESIVVETIIREFNSNIKTIETINRLYKALKEEKI